MYGVRGGIINIGIRQESIIRCVLSVNQARHQARLGSGGNRMFLAVYILCGFKKSSCSPNGSRGTVMSAGPHYMTVAATACCMIG